MPHVRAGICEDGAKREDADASRSPPSQPRPLLATALCARPIRERADELCRRPRGSYAPGSPAQGLSRQHVTSVSRGIARFDDDTSLALPRAAATDFKRAWGRFWLGESE